MKNNLSKINFVFFGTGDFATKVLKTLTKGGYKPDLIITAPDRPKGRKLALTPPPVKEWALENGFSEDKVLQPEKLDNLFIECYFPPTSHYPVFIVADYGKILSKEIIDIPRYKTINVHPSLLPKFRGASPIRSFLLSGEEKTGTTIMLMDEEMDHGPILAQRELYENHSSRSHLSRRPTGAPPRGTTFYRDFLPKLKHKELEEKLAEIGGQMLIEIIPDYITGKVKPKEQKHDQATYTKKISKNDGLIDLSESAEEIERKVRALTPWPGVYFFVKKNKRPSSAKATEGRQMRVIITDAEAKNGKLIIKKVKPEGKNEMPLEDFLRGNPEASEQIQRLNTLQSI